MRARPGDLGLGPATAGKAASDTRCRSVSHIIAWRLCISRPATIFSSGSLHTSAVYTILDGLYNSRATSIQFSADYTTLDLPYHARPAMRFSTGYAIIYRRAHVPSARVPRANAPECHCRESQCLEYLRYIYKSAHRPSEITYELHIPAI